MKTKQMYPDNIVLWFYSPSILEVFMSEELQDERIENYLRGLLISGEVMTVSSRKSITQNFAAHSVLILDENRLTVQKKIAEYLNSIGYESIIEEPE
ncbi:MAG: hypothetical protein V4467_04995 [Patescibacteria group bacterium]